MRQLQTTDESSLMSCTQKKKKREYLEKKKKKKSSNNCKFELTRVIKGRVNTRFQISYIKY